ncbi:D-glycero-beta-D-manno-heptose-7-phosphate kinase [Mucilaginibacter arboris]|uniref:D-glycero-beta-D-manno-heptose-7-phosphate kinase n=1 Tax=Mucilaginibacter arboris TaxID=2682090 RepID=A0A7K1SYM3_9SPHI|nr:D-glycero-beta-D-manno-heptose-7-phosphate kinase [Mucilaginibacter arboris]MVN22412.1 D-glycero-beta-D-manno-heptose-7-phosphate kinase [Mucilaginibacter arboris]
MLLQKIRSLPSGLKPPKILIIGDLMIDQYIWGDANRLSPEAPVPIVNVNKESNTLGGAGNVAQNLISFGAEVIVAGLIGDDQAGKELLAVLADENADPTGIVIDSKRPTTIKTRIIAGSYQIVRIDREVSEPISQTSEDELFHKIHAHLAEADIVLFSDYNKGVLSPSLCQRVITSCNSIGKKVLVDPKGLDFAKYKGAFIIKPNKKELAQAVKFEKIGSTQELKNAASALFELTDAAYLVVTLSEEGIAILTKESYQLLDVKATEVFDVTGAGDTVLATLAYFIALGFSVEEACELANHAAAIVIRRVGSATTSVQEILEDMENDHHNHN